jgi:hypothetical protein
VYCGIGADGWFFGLGFKEQQPLNSKKMLFVKVDITGKIKGIKYKKSFKKKSD